MQHRQGAPGAGTKNLFLCDEKGRQFILVMVCEEKRVDLKKLGSTLGVKNLRFASPERLQQYLGIEPGAVTALAVINDTQQQVQLYVDRDLWVQDAIQCHPLVNTSTLVISRSELERFFHLAHHDLFVVEIPTR